jgi:hypothetical protein
VKVNRLEVEQSHLNLSGVAGCQALMELMSAVNIDPKRAGVRVKKIDSGFTDTHYLQLLVLMLATQHSDFESVRELRQDSVIAHLLGLPELPHANTLREYLGRYSEAQIGALKRLMLQPLAAAQLLPDPLGYVPVDVDASIFEQHGLKKAGAAWAYDGTFGYQPLFMFIGRQGYALDGHLRPGNQNGVDQADWDIEKAFDRLPESVQALKLLYRFDAGFYAWDVVRTIRLLGKDLLIKAKLTAPLLAAIDALPASAWTPTGTPTDCPTSFAELTYQPEGWDTSMRYVVRREIRRADTLLPETHTFAYVTTLNHAPEAIDAGYRRRGMAENFIKELKHDLDLEGLPSGDFQTNQAFLHVGLLTYNLLVLLAQLHQDPRTPSRYVSGRMRLLTVRRQLLHIAGYLVRHARRSVLMFSSGYVFHDLYRQTLARIRALANAPPIPA